MSITSLDENTVRLITTTQIITSVYSAVKELSENAFDANAKNIEINLVRTWSLFILFFYIHLFTYVCIPYVNIIN